MLTRLFLTPMLGMVLAILCSAQVGPADSKQPAQGKQSQTTGTVPPLTFGRPLSSEMGKQWSGARIISGFNVEGRQQFPVPISRAVIPLPVFPIILCSSFPDNPILLMKGSAITI
jgi:hypothetical protein